MKNDTTQIVLGSHQDVLIFENCVLDRGLFVDSKAASRVYIRHHDDDCSQESEAELGWELGDPAPST